MAMNTTSVDAYLADGCGRCEHYRTPQCKVHLWTDALVLLREIVLAAGLVETMKWGSPCYTLDGENVVMLGSFRTSCTLSFLNAAGLSNSSGLLVPAGPSSKHASVFRFTSAAEVADRRSLLEETIAEAIALVAAGVRPTVSRSVEPVPEELAAVLASNPTWEEAFQALTPGRRRSYVLHVSGAKKSPTRTARAERCIPKILSGKGFNER